MAENLFKKPQLPKIPVLLFFLFFFSPIASALTVTTLDEEMERSLPPQKNSNMSFNESCILIACTYVLFKVLF